jgi:PEP-CTERM motif
MPQLRKLFFSFSAFVVIAAAATVSRADTINIIGVDTGAASTATVICTFSSGTLTFTITNTSPSGSTITGIGFDLIPGDANANDPNATGLNGFTGSQTGAVPPGSSVFSFSDGALGNVPHGFSDTVVLDFGFVTGGDFTSGSVGSGIAPGESASFTVSGAGFAGLTEAQICNAIFVRFQNVPTGEGSDVGVPGDGDTPAIPEPATLFLFGTGLAGVAAAARKRLQR